MLTIAFATKELKLCLFQLHQRQMQTTLSYFAHRNKYIFIIFYLIINFV